MENSKKLIKEELLNTINEFYEKYPYLPPMYLTDKDFDILLDVVEAYFLVHNIMDQYNHALNIIIRRAVYLAATNDKDGFIINHLSMALNDLSIFNLSIEEIKAMQSELFQRSFNYSAKIYQKR